MVISSSVDRDSGVKITKLSFDEDDDDNDDDGDVDGGVNDRVLLSSNESAAFKGNGSSLRG